MFLQPGLATSLSTDLRSPWSSYKFLLVRNSEVRHHVVSSQSSDCTYTSFFMKNRSHWTVPDVKKLYRPVQVRIVPTLPIYLKYVLRLFFSLCFFVSNRFLPRYRAQEITFLVFPIRDQQKSICDMNYSATGLCCLQLMCYFCSYDLAVQYCHVYQ